MKGVSVEYHVLDAVKDEDLLSLGVRRFDKAVCTMALMDMPEITPLLSALKQILKPSCAFVFSIPHPCFNSADFQRFSEMYEEEAGRLAIRNGIKMHDYLTPYAKKTEGIVGQPEYQYHFHRPLNIIFKACFDAGFVMDGIEEPAFPKPDKEKAGVSWADMPEIPPVLVVRMRLSTHGVD